MGDIVIRGALGIFTGLKGDAERASGDIRISKGMIKAVGNVPPEPGDVVLDASGCVVTPGLICTHHHLSQSVLKGVPAGMNTNHADWLCAVPFTYWHRFDEDALAVAVEIALVELLMSGCTTVTDHHYLFSENYGNIAEILFETAARLGMRFVLARGGHTRARGISTPGMKLAPTETLDGILHHVEGLVSKYHDPAPDAMRRVVFAPTTPLWSVEPEELSEIAGAARRLGLRMHSHLSESPADAPFTVKKYGKRPLHHLADLGWAGPDVWFAHLIDIDESEIAFLAETKTGMAHCPQSNSRIGAGIAPADVVSRAGGVVSLAVDGAGSNEACDMVSEMHAAWTLHCAVKGPNAVRCEDVLRWATSGGADVLGFPSLGRIAPGYAADIAVYDLSHPRYAGLHDPLIAPVASGGSANMRYVLVGGRPVVTNGAVRGVDLTMLSARASAVVRRLAS